MYKKYLEGNTACLVFLFFTSDVNNHTSLWLVYADKRIMHSILWRDHV